MWTDYYSTTVENQDSIWLPTTPITQTINYNMRFLISDNQINPIAWEVSKIEDINPKGITKITLKQVPFNPMIDNKELMIADYYKSKIEPEKEDELFDISKLQITYTSSPEVKVGGSYKTFSVTSEEEFDNTLITWAIDGLNDSDYSSTTDFGKIKIKMSKDQYLIGRVFTLNMYYDGKLADSVKVEVIGL